MIQLLIIGYKGLAEGTIRSGEYEFEIHCSDNALHALNSIIHLSPDAIVLNMSNKTLDGDMILKRIRRMQASKNVPVLLLASDQDEINVRMYLDEYNVGYLVTYDNNLILKWVSSSLEVREPEEQKRLIVVDDDPVILDTLRLFLGARYKVELYRNCASALMAMKRGIPDLMLLDIAMPDMDGISLYKAIRGVKGCERVPIVFETGMAGNKTIAECMQLGASGFVVKPLQKKALLEKIEEALAGGLRRDGKKKLFIIDEYEIVPSMIASLTKGEYEIIKGMTALQALNQIEKTAPDIILLNYDSVSFMLKKIREKADALHIPMVIMSKSPQDASVQKEMEHDNSYCLALPVKKNELSAVLQNVHEWR